MSRAETRQRRRIPRRYKLLGLVALLLASNATRCQRGYHARPGPRHDVAVLPAVAGGQFTEDSVEMVYQDIRPAHAGETPPVLLIHGSPMGSYDLQKLADLLGAHRRVIAPELPGFGRSVRRIPDYSFAAHAVYLDELMDRLGISNLHVVAVSQGGGVALELSRRRPDLVRSLSLISSIGVQEFELLGHYGLNRAIHGAQLSLMNVLFAIIPHFGWLDTQPLNIGYARNFYDSDMRPLRGYLVDYAGPMLLVHGHDDLLVPRGAARETRRLVPQSEWTLQPGGHLLAYLHPEETARAVEAFLDKEERGEALTRDRADPARREKSLQPFNPADVDKATGVAMVVIILLIALSSFISEDLACIGAGLLATQGVIDYFTAATGAFLGIFVGDLLLFWIGHRWGKAALRKPPLKWMIREDAVRESMKWFATRGPAVVLLSRFVPGSRLPTYLTAGILHTRFWTFFIFFLVAGVVWAPLLVWLSMKIGQRIIEILFTYKLYTLAAVTVTALLLWVLFKIVIPMFSFKGRRLLLSRWKRLTRWEFWPNWVIYPPMTAYILYLGIRYRSLTLFTAANPAIPLGGLLGESKKHILDSLAKRREFIARYEIVPAGLEPSHKEQAVIDFLDRHALSFPVVLKPDAGQRGLGVTVARNLSHVADYFAVPRPPTLVQEYAPGFEFGIFYYRLPSQPRGHIFSITEKRLPVIVGDGRHDIERLILKDSRAVCMAPYFLRKLGEQRYIVPAEDETVQLTEIGNHCRGAIFQDGRWIKTPELERAIDELSQGFPGFFFGRYDVRAKSLDELRAGTGFKVIELNGVTSESTNIYDPNNTLMDAYAVLARQWRMAFKIGDRNRRLGVRPASLREFFRALRDYEAAPEA